MPHYLGPQRCKLSPPPTDRLTNLRGMDMAGVVAALLLSMALAPASALSPLPSRELPIAYVELAEAPLVNFDIFDVRWELSEPPQYVEVAPHSIFVLRPHI